MRVFSSALPVAFGVAQPQDLVARGDVHRAVGMNGEVHRVRRALEEGGELVGLAVAVGVLEHADAVELRAPSYFAGRKCVWLSTTRTRPADPSHSHRMHDVRVLRKANYLQSVVRHRGMSSFFSWARDQANPDRAMTLSAMTIRMILAIQPRRKGLPWF